jgi:hypothetical protein
LRIEDYNNDKDYNDEKEEEDDDVYDDGHHLYVNC